MVQKKESQETKRRGRPRAYDPVEALRQARDVFWRHGYSGTSLDEISAATGMNRPSLSAAFGDKHALYLAALRGYWEYKSALMRKALEGGTLEQALLRAYDASLSLYFSSDNDARGCFVVGTAITEAVDDSEIRDTISAGTAMLDAAFKARFELAREAGHPRSRRCVLRRTQTARARYGESDLRITDARLERSEVFRRASAAHRRTRASTRSPGTQST